ncbi:MAG: hypothetical protein US70_C0009G0028 [Parcubacteria group bacterium GW2011_GWD2_38_11]|nr:MAG: hypothetical protein US70_C0009G0028 [Parcubacteria group bacterium GW2011_GWD2_38_11]
MDIEKQNEKKEGFSVDNMYTPLSVAKEEVWKRWNDNELRKKVEEYLGEIPEPFRAEPRVAISRNIITPNQELLYFLDLAGHTDLKPIGLEGVEDKFCTKNYDKVSLGKLSFLKNKNANKDSNESSNIAIIDMADSDGKRLCDIKTFWGENLVDFHYRLLESYGISIESFDDFKWCKHISGKSGILEYYKKFFAFFVCYGILFDNFIVKRNEKQFTDEVVTKSFKEIEVIFGVKPLIVPLLPQEDDDHWYFRSYLDNDSISELMTQKLDRKK